ncbi:hypothetical protein BASA61_009498 [Batrachochytrium salamandrivorans]|nr:hypothetical protein BASA61_009498 [Batrachochytrium salamandrivorans]
MSQRPSDADRPQSPQARPYYQQQPQPPPGFLPGNPRPDGAPILQPQQQQYNSQYYAQQQQQYQNYYAQQQQGNYAGPPPPPPQKGPSSGSQAPFRPDMMDASQGQRVAPPPSSQYRPAPYVAHGYAPYQPTSAPAGAGMQGGNPNNGRSPYQQQPQGYGFAPPQQYRPPGQPPVQQHVQQPGRPGYKAPQQGPVDTGANQGLQDWDDAASESTGTFYEDTPENRAGPAAAPGANQGGSNSAPGQGASSGTPNIPTRSYALVEDEGVRTNLGNTKFVMAVLSEWWIFSLIFIIGGTYLFHFKLPQDYVDNEIWNYTCFWKIGWILPFPYTLICFFGLVLPYRTPKFLYSDALPKRRIDNFYILTVTKGDNREAVYRSWNAHKHLERLHPCVRVHVLTDEPYFFENVNCYTCPKLFTTAGSKYKARALEWYRQTMRFTEHDWVLHLDEESVIDDESIKAALEFVWYEHDYHWGQGLILYNQYKFWSNWFFTGADAIRVGDDLSRFALQYSYFHAPIFGAHGSFLLNNGAVENAITWDLGSLTEDYQFATHAHEKGFRCSKVPGIVREQSPIDFIGFLKQRRRWFVGIRRLPYILPKVWAFFWAIGTLSLFCTLSALVLGFVIHKGTPRWFGFLKDFSFITFTYLYQIGIIVQNVDKKINPILIILCIPLTFLLQYAACVMEALAVIYGLISPPSDFDVIKK